MLRWQCCKFEHLTATEAYAIMAARAAVFVVEQNCAYQDLDGKDLVAQHVVVWSGHEVAACLRILPSGSRFAERSIGRVLTTARFRGTGLGRELMRRVLEHLDAELPGQPIRISAQARLERFYGDFGFAPASDVYLEDGLPHIEMLRAPG